MNFFAMTSSTRAAFSHPRSRCCAITSSAPAWAVRFAKDKSFFFANYEGLWNRRQEATLASVPTAGGDAGRFFRPQYRRAGPGDENSIPGQHHSGEPTGSCWGEHRITVSLPRMSRAPAAATTTFVRTEPINTTTNVGVARLDHDIFDERSDLRAIFGKRLGRHSTRPIYPVPGVDRYHLTTDNSFYSWSATWQHSFSPLATLEARYSWDRRKSSSAIRRRRSGACRQVSGYRELTLAFSRKINIPGLTGFGTRQSRTLQEPIRRRSLQRHRYHDSGRAHHQIRRRVPALHQ